MWHKAEWMGHPMRLKLSCKGLLVELANYYTTQGPQVGRHEPVLLILIINIKLTTKHIIKGVDIFEMKIFVGKEDTRLLHDFNIDSRRQCTYY